MILHSSHSNNPSKTDLPVIYKKFVAFFRHLYSYVRFMPAYALQKGLLKGDGAPSNGKIGYRISRARQAVSCEAGLGEYAFFALTRNRSVAR